MEAKLLCVVLKAEKPPQRGFRTRTGKGEDVNLHGKRQKTCWKQMDGCAIAACGTTEAWTAIGQGHGQPARSMESHSRCRVFPFPAQFLRF